MNNWAKHLQRYLISRGNSHDELESAIRICADRELGELLSHMPPKSFAALETAISLVAKLVKRGFSDEAAVLSLVATIPTLANAQHPDSLTADQRQNAHEYLNEMIANCITKPALAPSLALLLELRGGLHKFTKDFDAARNAYKQVFDIRCELDNIEPNVYSYELASVSNELGNILSDIHNEKQDLPAALKFYNQARDILDCFAEKNPKRYKKDYAKCLNNLGDVYGRISNSSRAGECYLEAYSIFQEISNYEIEIHHQDLVTTLNGLGNYYASDDSGALNTTTSLNYYERAREILTDLINSDPKNHQYELATILISIGQLHVNSGNSDVALQVYEEAHEISEKLVRRGPIAYSHQYADLCSRIGKLQFEAGNLTKAGQAFENAAKSYDKLITKDPTTYRFGFALNIANLGNVCFRMRDFTTAIEALQLAQMHFDKLAKDDPKSNEKFLAITYMHLGNCFSDTHHFELACEYYKKARDILTRVAKDNSKTCEPELASIHANLGTLYVDPRYNKRNLNDALESYKMACEILTRLAKDDPKKFEHDLAKTLDNLGSLFCYIKDFSNSNQNYENSLKIRRKLADSNPKVFGGELAASLSNLGNLYLETNNQTAAYNTYKESVYIAETSTTDDVRHLNKGRVKVAYTNLLSKHVDQPARAFSYAAAMRSGPACSSAFTDQPHSETQAVLQRCEEQFQKGYALLVPTTGPDETLILGLITSSESRWWHLDAKGWIDTFLGSAQHMEQAEKRKLLQQIWVAMPEEVQNALSSTATNPNEILISGDSVFSAFPWELLCFGDGECDFLGLHFALPRIGSIDASELEILTKEFRLGNHRKTMAIVAPHTTGPMPLLGVVNEVSFLQDQLPLIGGKLTQCALGDYADKRVWIDALGEGNAVLYFSGHGGFYANEEVLILHDAERRGANTYFGAFDLDQMQSEAGGQKILTSNPMIVLNCCYTGRLRDHGGQREDLIHSLMRHGAGAVIATALPISDLVGEALGRSLFGNCSTSQSSVGNLVIAARRQLANNNCDNKSEPNWGAWGTIHLYGTPQAKTPFQQA